MKIAIPVDKFIAEHKGLIQTLERGNKEKCAMEAQKQREELARVMARPGVKESMMTKRHSSMKRRENDPLIHRYDM